MPPAAIAEMAPRRPLPGPVIALIAFFTLSDLFATQAILPLLAEKYRVAPAMMAVAVNATTIGMAIGAFMVALVGDRLDRRWGVVLSLLLLAAPTALLAGASNLGLFFGLRVAQGLCMSTAFTLCLAYLGEVSTPEAKAGAFAAYVTGNVASNLAGRFIAAVAAGSLGVEFNFYLFAGLNLAGAALAFAFIAPTAPMARRAGGVLQRLRQMRALASPEVLAAFALGFCILFAFIGVFSYVNFVLMKPPLALGMMSLGFVYLVFLPSIIATPLAGRGVDVLGVRGAVWLGLGVALGGLLCLAAGRLPIVLLGLCLVGVGTFFAQAVATGFVSRAARGDAGGASGLYLTAYFAGGLTGSAVLGQAFDRFGWDACILGVAASLIVGAVLTLWLVSPEEHAHD